MRGQNAHAQSTGTTPPLGQLCRVRRAYSRAQNKSSRGRTALKHGMVPGMATKKVTITLDEEQLQAVRTLVEEGKTPNVSSFVKHAVDVALADVAGWGAMLGQALEQTGGKLTKAEKQWADAILDGDKKKRKRTAA